MRVRRNNDSSSRESIRVLDLYLIDGMHPSSASTCAINSSTQTMVQIIATIDYDPNMPVNFPLTPKESVQQLMRLKSAKHAQ